MEAITGIRPFSRPGYFWLASPMRISRYDILSIWYNYLIPGYSKLYQNKHSYDSENSWQLFKYRYL